LVSLQAGSLKSPIRFFNRIICCHGPQTAIWEITPSDGAMVSVTGILAFYQTKVKKAECWSQRFIRGFLDPGRATYAA
jgi:hypothetical protein